MNNNSVTWRRRTIKKGKPLGPVSRERLEAKRFLNTSEMLSVASLVISIPSIFVGIFTSVSIIIQYRYQIVAASVVFLCVLFYALNRARNLLLLLLLLVFSLSPLFLLVGALISGTYDYGLTLTKVHTVRGQSEFAVSGKFDSEPPQGDVWLVVQNRKDDYYWPQQAIRPLTGKEWEATGYAEKQESVEYFLLIVRVGKAGRQLFKYYGEVGKHHNYYIPLASLPDDAITLKKEPLLNRN